LNVKDSLGREALRDLATNYRQEYELLNDEEKQVIIRELDDRKATEAKSERANNKAKVKDITHTISAVEKEVGSRVTYLSANLTLIYSSPISTSALGRRFYCSSHEGPPVFP
jgi:hypothetical protein